MVSITARVPELSVYNSSICIPHDTSGQYGESFFGRLFGKRYPSILVGTWPPLVPGHRRHQRRFLGRPSGL